MGQKGKKYGEKGFVCCDQYDVIVDGWFEVHDGSSEIIVKPEELGIDDEEVLEMIIRNTNIECHIRCLPADFSYSTWSNEDYQEYYIHPDNLFGTQA